MLNNLDFNKGNRADILITSILNLDMLGVKNILVCVYDCFACKYVCIAHLCRTCGGQKRVSDPAGTGARQLGSRDSWSAKSQTQVLRRATSALNHISLALST